MEVKIRLEAGYDLGLYGFGLSYKDSAIDPEDWWPLDCVDCEYDTDACDGNGFSHYRCKYFEENKQQTFTRIKKAATANSGRGKGHDKFIRHIGVWIDINAPLSWWKQFDTYKVGTVASSESSMHCLHKRDMTINDCESTVIPEIIEIFNTFKNATVRSTEELNDNMPTGYKQRRLVTLNYAVLRCVIEQRKNHKLKYWIDDFIKPIYEQCEHPELLPKYPYED